MENFLNGIADFIPNLNIGLDDGWITLSIGESFYDNKLCIEHNFEYSEFYLKLPDINEFTKKIFAKKIEEDISIIDIVITNDDNVYFNYMVSHNLLLHKEGIYKQIYKIISDSIIKDLEETIAEIKQMRCK